MNTSAHILICDDSAFMRATLRNILEGMGLTNFTEAADGRACLEAIATSRPDLVLLDLIMPVKDGLATLKEIDSSIPVLVISAVGQEQVINEATDLGARAYIIKPFNANDVAVKVRAMLA